MKEGIMKIKREYCTVEFDTSDKIKEEVFQAVIDWFLEHDSYCSESIMQSDDTLMDSPVLMSQLADGVIKFNVDWD